MLMSNIDIQVSGSSRPRLFTSPYNILAGGKYQDAEFSKWDDLVDSTRHCRPSHRHLHHRSVSLKGFYNDVGDEDDERVNKVAESDVYLKRLITSLPMIVRNPKIVSQ